MNGVRDDGCGAGDGVRGGADGGADRLRGSDEDTTAGSGGGPDQAPITLSAEQIRAALPTDTSLGDVFGGADAVVLQGEEARRYCAEDSGTTCDGLVAAGKKELEVRGNADDGGVEFTLFSFKSPQVASAVAKGLAATELKDDLAE